MLPILDQLFLFHKLLPVCTLQWVKIVFEVAFLFLFTYLCPHKPLKYGFCKKYSDRNEPLTSWTILSSVFSRSVLIWKKRRTKVFNWSEVHFYRSNFLQNPYFNRQALLNNTLYFLKSSMFCFFVLFPLRIQSKRIEEFLLNGLYI